MPNPTSVAVEIQFSGSTWTNVGNDLLSDSVRVHYGISGNRPKARVASTGRMTFWLNNSASNTGGLAGYYSPNHANQRSGFEYGKKCRLKIVNGGTTYYKFVGKLTTIDPEPGSHRNRRTRCVASDWIDEAANLTIRDVAIQQDQRADQLFTTLLAVLGSTSQPESTSFDTGTQVFPFAFHDLAQGEKLLRVMARVVMAEFGFLAIVGDTSAGGVLRFFNRHSRAGVSSSLTIDDEMRELGVPTTLDNVYNRIIVTTHPVRVLPDVVVLAALTNQPFDVRPVLGPSETRTLWLEYRDPNLDAALMGASDAITPESTTDYLLNANQDGSGADLTSDLTVTATFFASVVKVVVTNGGSGFGYITRLQVRGSGVFDRTPVQHECTSAQTYGERELTVDLKYQSDQNVGQGLADFLCNQYDSRSGQIDSVSFVANRSATLLTGALAREPGDKITLTETQTGISSVGVFIQGVDLSISDGGRRVICRWDVAPDAEGDFWRLGATASDDLGTDTTLGYA